VWRIVLAPGFVSAFAVAACTANPYVIGAYYGSGDGGSGGSDGWSAPADGGSGPSDGGTTADSGGDADASTSSNLTFAASFDTTGASHLVDSIALPSGAIIAPTLRLRGETATVSGWPSDQGAVLARAQGASAAQRETPFTDATRAVAIAWDAPTYVAPSAAPGALDTGDGVFEIILRAAPSGVVADKRGAAAGWSLKTNASGALLLELNDGQRLVAIASEPLVPQAWYHCMFWVSRTAGGRADCDGRPGTLTDLSGLGGLASAINLAIGGASVGSGSPLELAYLSVSPLPQGLPSNPADWLSVGRRRFAALTGSLPDIARGSALPIPGVRDSPAYLDLDRGDGAGRHLFLVGPDWPRVACRTDLAGVRDCGYLSEPSRPRYLTAEPRAWTQSELTVNANHALFADGELRMDALIASSNNAPHVLNWTGTYGAAQQVLSFYARAEGGRFLGASVSGHGKAVFDVQAGAVVSAPAPGTSPCGPGATQCSGNGVQAIIEPWGGGLFRCAYIFNAEAGALTYRVHLLNAALADSFAGDVTTALADAAGLQLDVALAYPGSLIASSPQAADTLTFVADNGNLPAAAAVSLRLRLLLPAGSRLTDQAVVNLNLAGQFANQIELFVAGNSNKLEFWGLRDGATHWSFDHPTSAVDGLRHSVLADWDLQSAGMSIDGVPASQQALILNAPPFQLDRIDVGFSARSSGHLEGLVAGLEVGNL
jgi:hypothetical protein